MRIGDGDRGFSLIEMLMVLAIIGLLASVATPVVVSAVTRTREAALQQNLSVLRKLIDDYYADRGRFPPSLEALVEEGYLRAVPSDPVNDGKVEWELQKAKGGRGIEDVRSKSKGSGSNGVPYAKW